MTGEPFWEAAYRDPSADAFGEPSEEVLKAAALVAPGAAALDVGCGDGRNALALALAGCRVDAVDRSLAGVARLTARARARRRPVRAWVQDVADLEPRRDYDLVVCHGVLHLLEPAARDALLDRLRDATAPGGIHCVAVFTDALPPPPDLARWMVGLFRPGELAARYAEWETILARAYVLEDEHPGGVRHRHPVEKVVARRPGARDVPAPHHRATTP